MPHRRGSEECSHPFLPAEESRLGPYQDLTQGHPGLSLPASVQQGETKFCPHQPATYRLTMVPSCEKPASVISTEHAVAIIKQSMSQCEVSPASRIPTDSILPLKMLGSQPHLKAALGRLRSAGPAAHGSADPTGATELSESWLEKWWRAIEENCVSLWPPHVHAHTLTGTHAHKTNIQTQQ